MWPVTENAIMGSGHMGTPSCGQTVSQTKHYLHTTSLARVNTYAFSKFMNGAP